MLFVGKKEEYVEPVPQPPPEKHGSLFNRRRSSPTDRNAHPVQQNSTSPSHGSKLGSMLGRDREDKSGRFG